MKIDASRRRNDPRKESKNEALSMVRLRGKSCRMRMVRGESLEVTASGLAPDSGSSRVVVVRGLSS